MWSEDEKKAEVVRKVDNNKEQATKEQTENKNMVLNKDENIENTKSQEEAKGEDEQYGKPNQQYQKHQKVIVAKTKTREKKKENQWEKISTGEEDKNSGKTNKLETAFQITSGDFIGQKIEPELKEEEQTENRQQIKDDDAENRNTSNQKKHVVKRTKQNKWH